MNDPLRIWMNDRAITGLQDGVNNVVFRAVQMTVGGVVGRYRQILDGSFSSVSKPIFATKYSFFSVFRDLQALHALFGSRVAHFSLPLCL